MSEQGQAFEVEKEIYDLVDVILSTVSITTDVAFIELISNESDALNKMRFEEINDPNVEARSELLWIEITLNETDKTITITDTGFGMMCIELQKLCGGLIRVRQKTLLKRFKDGKDISMIGQFGVGFYSAFLVADRVLVTSKHEDDVALLFVPQRALRRMFGEQNLNVSSTVLYTVRQTEAIDNSKVLLPTYLNFVKGFVELPNAILNVADHTLTRSKMASIISEHLITQTLELLSEQATRDKDKYNKFYTDFGSRIKVGVIEDDKNREQLVRLLRYKSITSGENMRSLQEYVSRMNGHQKCIYYITGESKEVVVNSASVERVVECGYEVLLMVDSIDAYVVQKLKKYEGHELVSVTREGLELPESEEEEKTWRIVLSGSNDRGGQVFGRTRQVITLFTKRLLGLLKEDEGRKIYWPTGATIPLTIVKSDGGFTYDTSDMATIRHRLFEERANWLLYVVDAGQSTHLETIFSAARELEWYEPEKTRVEHIQFGVVLGEDKKKFKSRSGDTVRLTDLLDEGVQRAAAKLREKGRDQVMTPEELTAAQESVAYGCIRYADLSNGRVSDYVFSFDRMLDDRGNTAVYLLYAYARIQSIIRNANVEPERISEYVNQLTDSILPLDHSAELKLAKQLLRLSDVLITVLESLQLHKLCDYVYTLATMFHDFYKECYVVSTQPDGSRTINFHRMVLCSVTADVMRTCFKILGIRPVEKM